MLSARSAAGKHGHYILRQASNMAPAASKTPKVPKAEDIAASNPDKAIFPEDGLTKADLVDYYRRIAPRMLPHLKDRAITLRRFPDGIGEAGFFQKNTPGHFPDWIPRIRQKKEGGTVDYVGLDSAAALAYVADQGTVELHAALSRKEHADRPDQIIYDLDPSDDDFGKVQEVASLLRNRLERRDIPCFVKSTGSRGLHVVIPLDVSKEGNFDDARAWARKVAEHIAAEHEKLATVEQRKEKRGEKVFLDYLRNAYGQTAIAPYSLRARPGVPVATPLDWKEALAADMTPVKFTIRTIFNRLAQKDDPWADMWKTARSLAGIRKTD